MYNYGYDYGTTASQAAGFAGAAIGIIILFIFLGLICLAATIVLLIAEVKLFKKAGRPGWAALIPGYNNVLTCEMAGVDPRWVLIYFYGSIVCIVPILGGLAYAAAIIYYLILVNVSLARAFGKSDAFAVGLILLPVVFYPILGFGSATYGKTNPMNDIIFKKKAN